MVDMVRQQNGKSLKWKDLFFLLHMHQVRGVPVFSCYHTDLTEMQLLTFLAGHSISHTITALCQKTHTPTFTERANNSTLVFWPMTVCF